MDIKLSLKVIFVFISFNIKFVYTQQCYDVYQDAYYLYQFDEYKKLSDSILEFQIQRNTQNFEVYLLKAKLAFEKGNYLEVNSNLLKSIQMGCDIDHHIFTNKYFKNKVNREDSIKLRNEASGEIFMPNKNVKQNELSELYKLLNFDQALRYFTNSFKDSMCISEKKAMKYETHITKKLLKEYLDNFGYPDEKNFGKVLVDRFEKVIIHQQTDIDSCKWLKLHYDNAYKLNKISPSRYFNFYETFRVRSTGVQKTGAYEGRQRIKNTWEIFPIENLKSVDSLRSLLCLPHLHVFLKNNNFNIPQGYEYNFNEYIKMVRRRIENLK